MIDMKGRNGWFKLRTVKVRKGALDSIVEINWFSQREGTTVPVVIQGSKDEVVALLQTVLNQVQAGEGDAQAPQAKSRHLVSPEVPNG